MNFWLMKTEPEAFSIDDLKRKKRSGWDGVRNYQARNYMRDSMRQGDGVLIYHSNADPTGVAGLARVSRESHPDPTAWDPDSKYFDPKSSPQDPRWFMVEVEFAEKFPSVVTLEAMRADPALDGLLVIKRGMRLSIQPVEKGHYDWIVRLGNRK